MRKVVPELLRAFPVVLVIEPQDEKAYVSAYRDTGVAFHVLPENDRGIGYARNMIQEIFSRDDVCVMIDDDTEGYSKRNGEKTSGGYPRLTPCAPIEAIRHLVEKTKKYGIACLSHRRQNWFLSDPPHTQLMWNTVGLSPSLREKGVLYRPQLNGFEDYEITAQAVLAGFCPYMSPHYCFNTSDAIGVLPGGLQSFDRVAEQEKSIREILALYGTDVVKLVTNKKSGRTEIRFRWRRLEKQRRNKNEDPK